MGVYYPIVVGSLALRKEYGPDEMQEHTLFTTQRKRLESMAKTSSADPFPVSPVSVVSQLEILVVLRMKIIKTTPALMHTPIVVAAGSENPEFVTEIYKQNGNWFMRKPEELPVFGRFIRPCYEVLDRIIPLPTNAQRARR
jgi:hypothetical protein